ncbi:hypothetical protein RhiirA5_356229 [Rhizophagus irregularis]|uniref:Uncharacterized protein n=1 Tax=Rhizophagus irregularis TaxID=588596 RepID=A0A2N0PSN3_9GLOM|nr:hypothetical protein RhiirA5_356229 [Rhizophagus irregularis]
MVDIELVYNLSIHKLQNFQSTRRDSDGLRKLVLLNNFVYEKFVSPEPDVDLLEWSEEDIKKDEESWLDSCLDELDEDDYVHVNVKPLDNQPTVSTFPIDRYDDPRHYEDHYIQDNNAMEYENHSHEQQQQQQLPSKDNHDVIIPHDLLHLPFFDPGDNYHMDIEEEHDDDDDDDDDDSMDIRNSSSQDDDINMTKISSSFEYLPSEKGFHPYWKDNSIIGQIGHPSSRSFGIPKIFHKYRFDQVVDSSSPRRISPPNAVLELLQSNYIDSPLRRSKDDLDILYSLTPKDLDRGILMDMISMLEYYGSKANHNIAKNSSEINDMWFMDNNHR